MNHINAEIAMTLNNIANALKGIQKKDEALKIHCEVLEIRRLL